MIPIGTICKVRFSAVFCLIETSQGKVFKTMEKTMPSKKLKAFKN